MQEAEGINREIPQIKTMDGNCSLLILTWPDSDLKELKKDVAKSVMLAALGVENPCDGVGNKNSNGFETKEGYDWNCDVGPMLNYYAKKGGPASMTDYDFKIEFDGGKPRVWGEDYDKASCDVVRDVLPDQTEYQSYNLNLIVNEEDCLIKFGTADYYHKREQLLSLKPYGDMGRKLSCSSRCV